MQLFRPTSYFRPSTIDEAISLLAKHGSDASILAGGTDVLVEKNPKIKCLIDISRLGLDYIRMVDDHLKIGTLTTFRCLESSLLLDGSYRILVDMAKQMGSVAIRNIATIGGNICKAQPSADSPPPLIALESKARIIGSAGERIVKLEEFFLGVGKSCLKKDELLVEFQISKPLNHTGVAFLKIGRSAVDLALVNVAIKITLNEASVCEDARIVIGTVAQVPFRAKKAESLLKDKAIVDSLIDKVAIIASNEAKPRTTLRASEFYRREMIKVLVKKALKQAYVDAQGVE